MELGGPRANLTHLPEEVLLLLSQFLKGSDLLRLSHVCSRTFSVFNNDFVWNRVLVREDYVKERSIKRYAASLDPPSVGKLSYIFHTRNRRRWHKGHFEVEEMTLPEGTRYGHDDRYLVIMTRSWTSETPLPTWRVRVWDISGKGKRLIVDRKQWSVAIKTDFELTLNHILVAKHTALLCFTGQGNDTPQELIAFDLVNQFAELWRDCIYDWGQFQLPTCALFGKANNCHNLQGLKITFFYPLSGEGVYKLNLLTNRIEVYDIRSFDLLHSVALVEEMRYPRGEISGDGKYLVIPGKLSVNNAPTISVWNVRRGTQRFLNAKRSFCPFRWFEKTSVKSGRVFALLNRRCMFVWDAESGECLREVDLTDSPPGEANEPALSFNFLSLSKSLVATIHSLVSVTNVFDHDGNVVRSLEPPVANAAVSPFRVCEVQFAEHCILVRTIQFRPPRFQVTIYPLTLGEDGIASNVTLIPPEVATPVGVELLPVTSAAFYKLGVTPTKLLNFGKGALRMYDFL